MPSALAWGRAMDLEAGRTRASSLRGKPRALVLPGPWSRKKLAGTLAALSLMAAAQGFAADLHIVPAQEPVQVFAPREQKIPLLISNGTERLVEVELRAHVYQTTSATAVTWSNFAWKTVRVLPGQTALELAVVQFPAVRGRTRFVVHWLAETGLAGRTIVWVYPADLLKELRPMAGPGPLGVYDPDHSLTPLLEAVGQDWVDLADTGFEQFSGRLAICLVPTPPSGVTDIAERAARLARRGAAVVWMEHAPTEPAEFAPSCQVVPEGKGSMVFARAGLLDPLADDPQAQLNLIGLARLAVKHVRRPD